MTSSSPRSAAARVVPAGLALMFALVGLVGFAVIGVGLTVAFGWVGPGVLIALLLGAALAIGLSSRRRRTH